jgi:hypothetical protein
MKSYNEILDSIARDHYDMSVLITKWKEMTSLTPLDVTFRFFDGSEVTVPNFAKMGRTYTDKYTEMIREIGDVVTRDNAGNIDGSKITLKGTQKNGSLENTLTLDATDLTHLIRLTTDPDTYYLQINPVSIFSRIYSNDDSKDTLASYKISDFGVSGLGTYKAKKETWQFGIPEYLFLRGLMDAADGGDTDPSNGNNGNTTPAPTVEEFELKGYLMPSVQDYSDSGSYSNHICVDWMDVNVPAGKTLTVTKASLSSIASVYNTAVWVLIIKGTANGYIKYLSSGNTPGELPIFACNQVNFTATDGDTIKEISGIGSTNSYYQTNKLMDAVGIKAVGSNCKLSQETGNIKNTWEVALILTNTEPNDSFDMNAFIKQGLRASVKFTVG